MISLLPALAVAALAAAVASSHAQTHQHAMGVSAPPSVDARQLVQFPEPMRLHTTASMRDHLLALQEISSALSRGAYEQAKTYLLRAGDQLPRNSVIQDHYGDALAGTGKWSEAVAAWQRALAGDGESIDTAAIEKKIRDGRRRR